MTLRLAAPSATPHPVVFLILILPFGVMSGYLTVTIVYMLTQAGVPVDESAALVAISYIPHSWKFVWAPLVDTTLSRKTWYLCATVVSGLGIYATGAVPAEAGSLPLLTAVVLLSNFAVTFLAMSVESLMAYGTPEGAKGRSAGWFQAGNLGGFGLGGGAGLWIARSRRGFLGLLICFLPIGTGAASNLWSALAGDWHASAETVAMVTGVLSGIVMAAGCFAGGYVCDRMDRKAAYALFGVLMALCAVAMALAPRSETMYAAFTLIYAFINGLAYAGFSAVALEAIGLGAAATKYNLFASLSNIPIGYMTAVDGWAAARWGPGGMLHAEAAIGLAALLVFTAVAVASARPREQAT